MRIALAAAAAAALVVCTGAAAPPPPSSTTEVTFVTGAEVAAVIAKEKAGRTQTQQLVTAPIFRVPPYTVNIDYRPVPGAPSVHANEAEFFYVVEGSGTLISGGRMVRPASGPATIEGGTSRAIAKGDFFMVPAGVPHGFGAGDGNLAVMTVHLPLETAASAATPSAR